VRCLINRHKTLDAAQDQIRPWYVCTFDLPCVCMYAHMRVCMHVIVSVCMLVCLFLCSCLLVCSYVPLPRFAMFGMVVWHVCMYVYLPKCVCTSVLTNVPINVCMRSHTPIDVCMHARIRSNNCGKILLCCSVLQCVAMSYTYPFKQLLQLCTEKLRWHFAKIDIEKLMCTLQQCGLIDLRENCDRILQKLMCIDVLPFCDVWVDLFVDIWYFMYGYITGVM